MPIDASIPLQAQQPNTLGKISDMLQVRQQRQALQTGQLQQQQVQLETQKQQGLQNFFQNWDPGDHIGSDGTTDLDSALQSPAFKSAGNAKPAVMQALLDVKNKQLDAKTSLASLNGNLVKQFGTAVGALADDDDVKSDKTDPSTGVNAGRAKVGQFIQNFSKLSPDAARIAGIYGPLVQHIPPGKLGRSVQALQLQAQSASEQQSQQNPQSVSVNTGAATQFGTAPKNTGIPSFNGPTVQTQLGPEAKLPRIMTNAAGQAIAVNPQNPNQAAPVGSGAAPTAAGLPPGGGPPTANPNPTTAQAAIQNVAASGIANRVQQAQSAANNTIQAQDALTRARAILDQPNAPNTGAGFEMAKTLKNTLSTLGIDTQGATDANSLVKNLARYEASRATQAGLGGTDAARELAHSGSPNVSIDNKALKGIVSQSLATEKALAAYANVQGRAKDQGGLTKNEADFRSIPNLIEGYEYGLSRSPQEADDFLKAHGISRAEMKKTRQRIKEFEGR